jgi:hypothetical protein
MRDIELRTVEQMQAKYEADQEEKRIREMPKQKSPEKLSKHLNPKLE